MKKKSISAELRSLTDVILRGYERSGTPLKPQILQEILEETVGHCVRSDFLRIALSLPVSDFFIDRHGNVRRKKAGRKERGRKRP